MVLVKKLELSAKERITLETFRQLTDINQNADLVFMDWDLNGIACFSNNSLRFSVTLLVLESTFLKSIYIGHFIQKHSSMY